MSSTFLDMQNERDILMNKIFPNFQRKCALLGISFESVDLRWGITEEKPQDEVISFCMDQISACHPFFIGMIGGRYGWVPMSDPTSLSITEQEFKRYETALKKLGPNPEAQGAIYCVRDDSLTKEFAKGNQRDFYDADDNLSVRSQKIKCLEEFRRRFGSKSETFDYKSLERFESEISKRLKHFLEQQSKGLDSNRKRINVAQRHYLALLRSHANADDIAVSVKQILRDQPAIDPYFPVEFPNPVDFLQPGHIVVLTGKPGSGKTTLSQNWIKQWQDMHHDSTVLAICIGASGELTLNGIVRDLNDLCNVDNKAANWADQLCEILGKKDGRILIMLDGLERMFGWNDSHLHGPIESITNQQDQFRRTLTNIKEYLEPERDPPSILLTLDQSSFEDSIFKDKEKHIDSLEGVLFAPIPLTILQINPLDENQRFLFAESYLRRSGKSLSESQSDIIRKSPLLDFDSLIFALNRLRRFGGLKTPDMTQDHFIEEEIKALFSLSRKQSIYNQFEIAFSASWLPIGATKMALGLLVTTYYGLTAEEICAVVNKGLKATGEQFSSRDWAVVEGLLGPMLVRNGARFKPKNDDCKNDITNYICIDLTQKENLSRLIIAYVIERDTALGLLGILLVQSQHTFPNELAMQLDGIPEHPDWQSLLSPLHLALWAANDWEIALFQINRIIQPHSFSSLINKHWTFRVVDELNELEKFLRDFRGVWEHSDEHNRDYLEKTLNRGERILCGMQLSLSSIQHSSSNKIGHNPSAPQNFSTALARLFIIRTGFIFRYALADVAPKFDNFIAAINYGVDLLDLLSEAQVKDDLFADIVVSQITAWAAQAYEELLNRRGQFHSLSNFQWENSLDKSFDRLKEVYKTREIFVPQIVDDFLPDTPF